MIVLKHAVTAASDPTRRARARSVVRGTIVITDLAVRSRGDSHSDGVRPNATVIYTMISNSSLVIVGFHAIWVTVDVMEAAQFGMSKHSAFTSVAGATTSTAPGESWIS